MLTATAAANVKFCLDAHWVFRGCGDSQVAVSDAVEHLAIASSNCTCGSHEVESGRRCSAPRATSTTRA